VNVTTNTKTNPSQATTNIPIAAMSRTMPVPAVMILLVNINNDIFVQVAAIPNRHSIRIVILSPRVTKSGGTSQICRSQPQRRTARAVIIAIAVVGMVAMIRNMSSAPKASDKRMRVKVRRLTIIKTIGKKMKVVMRSSGPRVGEGFT
jgi:hypothetical protein